MNPQNIAIITGVTGQDGTYLAQFLLEKGYVVYGTCRQKSVADLERLETMGVNTHPHFHLVEHALSSLSENMRLLHRTKALEVYNLAAQSFVGGSFEQPVVTAETTGLSALYWLEAIRQVNTNIRFFQASTSEMFGKTPTFPQTENTPFHPASPYGVAKLNAHWMTVNYRENYHLFACSGILFNHESPLRGLAFVTRKITDAVAKISLGQLDVLELGNLDAKRDWGYAKDYVEGMWKMLQAEKPDTFVLATNRAETIRNFVTMTFKLAGYTLQFKGSNEKEVGIDVATGKVLVRVNPKFYRPVDASILIGNATKAKEHLNWTPKTSLEMLCELMLQEDLRRNRRMNPLPMQNFSESAEQTCHQTL